MYPGYIFFFVSLNQTLSVCQFFSIFVSAYCQILRQAQFLQ